MAAYSGHSIPTSGSPFASPSPNAAGGGQNGKWTPPPSKSTSPRGYRHILDLQKDAAGLDVSVQTPLSSLLRIAQDHARASKSLVDFQQYDRALVDYIKASEIALNIIPHHYDFHTYRRDRPTFAKQYTELSRLIAGQYTTIEGVKKLIQEDNIHSGVRPGAQSGPPTTSAATGARYGNTSPQASRPTSSLSYNGVTRPGSEIRADYIEGPPVDALAQRFARLGSPQQCQANGARPPAPLQMPVPSDFTIPAKSYSSGFGVPSGARLNGPRAMPDAPRTVLPPVVALPRAPSPTYSPVKTVVTPSFSNPPRTSSDSVRSGSALYKTASAASQSGMQGSNPAAEYVPYRPYTPNGINLARVQKSSSSDIPNQASISAEQLYDYLRKYKVLLVDVRTRQEYDQGHVFAKSIMCIEPVALRENMSAEDLEERLVLSLDSEQKLFETRNEFDLVVYYDQDTSDTSYLQGPPTRTRAPALRFLHDVLYEFNAYKPLKDGRRPALLAGGLEAWSDLVGPQSLATSNTCRDVGSRLPSRPLRPSGRPIARVPLASANSSLEVRRRRLRDYKPLTADEEHAWRQKVQQEEVETPVADEISGDEAGEDEVVPPSPFVHTYEDFLRKFPEPGAIQQSMIMPTARAPTLPDYFEDPAQSVAPSRPPPAVPRPSYSGVADGTQIQAPLARQNSAARPALYSSNSVNKRIRLPQTGLMNFGVTCYMNSTIQCLSATIEMSKFFTGDRYRHYIQKKNWKGSQGIIPDLYANLVRSLWKNDVEVIKPTSFRNFCGRMNREWAIDRQQDAKEFFDFLIDCLHEDLNQNWNRTPLAPLTFEQEIVRERMDIHTVSKIEWSFYSHRELSFISHLFAGQHASRLRCTTCRNTSTTYEAFYSISVEIPRTGETDIYTCLKSYCQEEMLSGDEVWKCPHCKCEREATKQIIITRAPQILVVHFKRFSASKNEATRKVHTPIDFPLHGLNMDKFMLPLPSSAQANGATKPAELDAASLPPYTYDAYGVLRHIGASGNSGHYISLVKDASKGCWRRFDDERVTDFEPKNLKWKDRLQNEQAYIVFYERVGAR